MSKVVNNITELIGKTPIIRLAGFEKRHALKSQIYAKLEYMNLTGSIKDRIAKAMIEDAEDKGLLKPGSCIIEPTSGNTGVGLAALAAARGYKIILTMPETMSEERKKLLASYGAKLVLTSGEKGMKGSVDKALELVSRTPNAFMPGQFENPANPEAHRQTTGPEIWNDTQDKVDIFIAGVGTGGTITGTGEYLKSKNPNIKIIAVEPFESPVLSEGRSGAHGIAGIGAGFVPKILNTKIYNEVVTIKEKEAYNICRELAKTDGIMVGASSGAAVAAALKVSQQSENHDKSIVIILPDTGERYLSTRLFSE